MSNYILFVFEGEVTEELIFNHIRSVFEDNMEKAVLVAHHKGEIYSLYHKMIKDTNIDLVDRLKEVVNSQLDGIDLRKISEVYLFFDFDGHAPSADPAKLTEMLKHFDNETENGKLFISYPMVEAIRGIFDNQNFKDTTSQIDIGREYKKLVEKNSSLPDINLLSTSDWIKITELHCKKLRYLMEDVFSFPEKTNEQIEVLIKQIDKQISPYNRVAVLSAFPIFLLDYYGAEMLLNMLPTQTPSSFHPIPTEQ